MKKRIPEFSKNGYKEVLREAIKKDFSFICFSEIDKLVSGKKYCLNRHDIDISLKCALEIAEIEHQMGVRATYFFMFCSPAYNLLSRYANSVLKKIIELGHEIGLHFDAAHPSVNKDNLLSQIEMEVELLSRILGTPISAVSFHQPSVEILKGNINIPGLINTYNKDQLSDWYYISDSNRQWKEQNAFSVFEVGQFTHIQMLVHPIWWMYDDLMIEDVWDHAVADNFYIMQHQFLDTEGAYGDRRCFQVSRQ